MNHTDNHFFLNLYLSHYSNNSKSTTILKRQDLRTINGDAFYTLNSWPSHIKRIFWQKPITDKDTFKLFLFFTGNGGSPNIIAEWILNSQYWGNGRFSFSVLPLVSKIMERAVQVQLLAFFEVNKVLSLYQSGFRKKHSTETAVVHLVDHILEHMDS